jgi:hypothetical protein
MSKTKTKTEPSPKQKLIRRIKTKMRDRESESRKVLYANVLDCVKTFRETTILDVERTNPRMAIIQGHTKTRWQAEMQKFTESILDLVRPLTRHTVGDTHHGGDRP